MLIWGAAFAAFGCGWWLRHIIDEKKKSKQRGEPELLWFNDEKSRWERVTKMQLCVADHVVVTVPIKLIKRDNESW